MKVKQEKWSIQKLNSYKYKINLNPIWQRGPAWQETRQVLLIDSILRGMDIPKVYLRTLHRSSPFSFEAVDGQQRLRAIWAYQEDGFPLNYTEDLPMIDGYDINGMTFTSLPKQLQKRLESFEVVVAKIVEAENDEITNLFARLQMGVLLNPAELRNAIQGPVRHVIDTLATTHAFFLNSRIAAARYKRQDYVTHVMALCAHQLSRDIKAPDLKKFVQEYGSDKADQVLEMAAEVGDALNILNDVNLLLSGAIRHKWIFVDLCWFVMQREQAGNAVDFTLLAQRFSNFDELRRTYTRAPEEVLQAKVLPKALSKHLYAYLIAFKTQGGTKEHLGIRAKALNAFFADT